MNKNIIALGFVSFFTDMASSMVTTILPIYIVYILHEGVDTLGFVIAISTFVSYAFRILFGYLSDKYKIVKPFVLTGYIISAITKPLLYFTSSWHSIATLRGVERIGKAVRSASKDSLISSYADKNSSGKTFGFHKTLDIAGELTGAIITFLLLWQFGKNIDIFKDIFAWTLVPGSLAVLILIFFVEDIQYKTKQNLAFDIKNDYKILPVLFVYFGFLFFMFDNSFYIIKAKELDFRIEYIPLLVILLTLTQTLFSYFFGIQIDKFGARRVLLVSFGFGILSILSLYLSQIILGFIFLGLFLVASLNSMRSYISDNSVNKATVYGILYGGVALSSALGAIVTGLIWQNIGESMAIMVSISGLIIVFIVSVFAI